MLPDLWFTLVRGTGVQYATLNGAWQEWARLSTHVPPGKKKKEKERNSQFCSYVESKLNVHKIS